MGGDHRVSLLYLETLSYLVYSSLYIYVKELISGFQAYV